MLTNLLCEAVFAEIRHGHPQSSLDFSLQELTSSQARVYCFSRKFRNPGQSQAPYITKEYMKLDFQRNSPNLKNGELHSHNRVEHLRLPIGC